MGRGRHAGYDDQRDLILARAAAVRAWRLSRHFDEPGGRGLRPVEGHAVSLLPDKYALLVSIADGHVSRLQRIVAKPWPRNRLPKARCGR
jgi:hypothetical protein